MGALRWDPELTKHNQRLYKVEQARQKSKQGNAPLYKQSLGAQTPQSWKKCGPERIAHLAFLLYSLVWLWYLQTQGTKRTWKIVPWYPQKQTASFMDALASLRKTLWRQRIITTTGKTSVPSNILTALIDVVAAAA